MASGACGNGEVFLTVLRRRRYSRRLRGARPSVLISVEELKLHPVSISETYPTGALDYQTTDFRQSDRLKVRGTAELVGQDIRFRGHLSTRIESTCARCLVQVEIPVETDFDLTYQPM